MMGLDTPETCRCWRNILRIICASSWFFFTRFFPHSSRRVFCKSSPLFKVINLLVHAISGVHLTPSLTDTPHLFTNVSNFGVWLRRVFELRQRFDTIDCAGVWVRGSWRKSTVLVCGCGDHGESRLCWCVGAGIMEKVDCAGVWLRGSWRKSTLPVKLVRSKLDFCLTVHYQLGKVIQMNQLDATMIYWSIRSIQHVSGNILPIIRSVRLRYLQHMVPCCCGG